MFKPIKIYESLPSTNKFLKENNFPDGTVIIAKEQTAGIGRQGKKFLSPKNSGLYMSFILSPSKEKFPFLTIISAIALHKTLQDYGVQADVKWVNDLYLNRKKISGILTEFKDTKAIIGIGINITNSNILQNNYGFLDIQNLSPQDLATNILKNFVIYYNLSNNLIIEKYKSILSMLGKTIYLEKVKATAIDINEFGHLIISINGKLKTIVSGEIEIL